MNVIDGIKASTMIETLTDIVLQYTIHMLSNVDL